MTNQTMVCRRYTCGCGANVVDSALVIPKEGTMVDYSHKDTVSNIIVAEFNDVALLVLRDYIGDTTTMMEKLDVSFESASTTTKI